MLQQQPERRDQQRREPVQQPTQLQPAHLLGALFERDAGGGDTRFLSRNVFLVKDD